MSTHRKPREVFLALVEGICAGRLDDVVKLYAEKTDISHPFDPLRGEGLKSRAALEEHSPGGRRRRHSQRGPSI